MNNTNNNDDDDNDDEDDGDDNNDDDDAATDNYDDNSNYNKQQPQGPFRYLANYKNPCWMEPGEDAPVVYCVPYFYLAGAPKAGSTDVFRRLIMHPDIAKAASKETRWFDRGRFAGEFFFCRGGGLGEGGGGVRERERGGIIVGEREDE